MFLPIENKPNDRRNIPRMNRIERTELMCTTLKAGCIKGPEKYRNKLGQNLVPKSQSPLSPETENTE